MKKKTTSNEFLLAHTRRLSRTLTRVFDFHRNPLDSTVRGVSTDDRKENNSPFVASYETKRRQKIRHKHLIQSNKETQTDKHDYFFWITLSVMMIKMKDSHAPFLPCHKKFVFLLIEQMKPS